MKILFYLYALITVISCNGQKASIDITNEHSNKPLKIVVNTFGKDSTNIYLLFPQKLEIFNNSDDELRVIDYHIGLNSPKGKNARKYRIYDFKSEMLVKKNSKNTLKPNSQLALEIYSGYLVKIPTSQAEYLIENGKQSQKISKNTVYDIQQIESLTELVNNQNDISGSDLYLTLSNDEKGIFYEQVKSNLFENK